MTTPVCSSCGRPVADNAYLCDGCTFRLERALGDTPALSRELDTTKRRQSRSAGSGIGFVTGSTTRPLPFDPHAVEVADDLKAILVGWTRTVYDERVWCGHFSCMNVEVGPHCPAWRPLPEDASPALAVFLLAAVGWLRHQQYAQEVLEEVCAVVARVQRAVDARTVEKSWAGLCGSEYEPEDDEGERCCLAQLYTVVGAPKVKCKACGTEHDAADRQSELLNAAEDYLLDAGWLAKVLTRPGMTVTEKMIWGLDARGRIASHGLDGDGRKTYRVGDVRRVINENRAKRKQAS